MRFLPLASLLLLSACGQQVGATSADPRATETVTSTVTQTVTPTPTPTPAATTSAPTEPTTSSSATVTRPTGPAGALLTADELPAAPGGATWEEHETGPEGDAGAGTCQLTNLTTIGATDSVRRTFTDSSGGSAVQVVAEFADPKSAWRSFEVLKSWRSDCQSRHAGSSVSPASTIDVSPAVGLGYTVIQGVDASKQYERVGLVRDGAYISLIAFFRTGLAEDDAPGEEPETLAVQAVAQLLG